MFKTMARLAKRKAVGRFVSQFWIRGKRLDMVRVQFNSMAVSAAQAATLAGVVVTLKNGGTPELVFYLAAGYAVLMGLVNMTLPTCRLRFLCLFGGKRICHLCALWRARFSDHAALAVLGHWLVAHGTRRGYRHALSTHLVKHIKVVRSLSAHLAGYADASGIRLQSGGARDTSRILDRLPQRGNGWRWFTALTAWSKGGMVARIADTIVSAVRPAFDAPVLCHASIIPQLPNLEKLR